MGKCRNTPIKLQRQLRQEANFGCCRCGHPLLDNAHIIPYHISHAFPPEDMLSLCPTCHRMADDGNYSEKPYLKWKRNLKKDSTEWIKFSNDSLVSIFPVPLGNCDKSSEQQQQIRQLEVTDKSISFLMEDRKYCLILDKEKKQAIPYINGEEVTAITYEPQKACLEVKRDCYVIYKLEFPHVDSYVKRLGFKFNAYLHKLEFPLGLSILKVFLKHSIFAEAGAEANKDNSIKIYYNDLKILAKDEKIKNLINKINSDIQQHYKDFLRFSQ